MNRKEKALVITICANFLLIALKFILAGLSGSLALKAGAWHSFSDIFVSGVVLTGLLLSRREDTTRSKGISRIENIISILVSFFILYVGYEIFQEVVKGDGTHLNQLPVVIIGAILTIIISYFMARYKIYVGKKTNSPSLVADGYHSLVDMFSSIIVVVGLTGYLIGLQNMDRLAAVVVVILIVLTGIEIFTNSAKALRKGGFPQTEHRVVHFKTIWAKLRPVKLFVIPILFLTYFSSGIYIVKWDQIGIEKRFGKIIETNVDSGLHYRLPWPVGQVDLVSTAKVHTVEAKTAMMLTGDENIVEISTSAHYMIDNAINYTYRVDNPEQLVRYAVESAARQVVSQVGIDSLLTTGKQKIISKINQLTQEILDRALSGIRLTSIQLLQAVPPQDVRNAFQEVASAWEDRATYLNEALAYQNEIVPVSKGLAAETIAKAQGYKKQKINHANGEAQNFIDRLKEYQKASEVTQTRMYIETMEKILSQTEKLIVDSRIDVGSTDLWLGNKQIANDIVEGVNK